jgi:site-specific DNA recombinase
MKRVILYARVSGDDRRNATSSIQSQLADCRKYAEQKGYGIVGEYFEEPDKPTSGADWLPELDKIIKLAANGTFDVLVVREIDRLARNRFKQMSVEIELEVRGVLVEYAIGQFEHSPEGRLLKGMMSEFAEFEREKIKQRIQRGRLRSVEAGNVTVGGSVAPYGYDLTREIDERTKKEVRSLVINETEAAVVRLIFDLYTVKLMSMGEIREYLEQRRIPQPGRSKNRRKTSSKGDGMWRDSTISLILSNESYIGRWHYRKTRVVKNAQTGKKSNLPRPREEWMGIAVPAIISDAAFEAARQRKEANKVQKGRQRSHQYALGGMLTCGRCGSAMSGIARGVYRYYKCCAHISPKRYGFSCDAPAIPTAYVETAVWNWLKGFLLSPEALRVALEYSQQQQQERLQPLLSMIESNQARLGELEGRKERLIDAYMRAVIGLDELAAQKGVLDKEIGGLTQAIAALRAEVEPQMFTPEHVERIETIAAELRTGVGLVDDDPQVQRHIFQLLDVHVTLGFSGVRWFDGRRWADVSCTLGNESFAVTYNKICDSVASV